MIELILIIALHYSTVTTNYYLLLLTMLKFWAVPLSLLSARTDGHSL